MGLHLCTDGSCPYVGQPSPARACDCHETDEKLLLDTLWNLARHFNDIGCGTEAHCAFIDADELLTRAGR